jgi:membrane-associated phospholipid phosphatase
MRIALLAGTLIVVATLVHLGATDPVDRFGLQHVRAESFDSPLSWVSKPTSPVAFTAALAAVCAALIRRGRASEAVVWISVAAAAAVIEVLGKLLVDTRFNDPDPVYDLFTLQNAFPSGHAMRSVLLAGLVATVLPRTRRFAAAWAAVACLAIVAGGIHVATEVVGGALVAVMLLAAVPRATRRGPLPPLPARS